LLELLLGRQLRLVVIVMEVGRVLVLVLQRVVVMRVAVLAGERRIVAMIGVMIVVVAMQMIVIDRRMHVRVCVMLADV
jgi:hypothetical protein